MPPSQPGKRHGLTRGAGTARGSSHALEDRARRFRTTRFGIGGGYIGTGAESEHDAGRLVGQLQHQLVANVEPSDEHRVDTRAQRPRELFAGQPGRGLRFWGRRRLGLSSAAAAR